MRSFIIALILLTAAITAVFVNSVYGTAVYSEMLDILEKMPDNTEIKDGTGPACSFFANHKNYLYYTLCEGTVNDLLCDFYEAVAYFEAGDIYSYSACLEKVKFRANLLKDSESGGIINFLTADKK